MQNPQQPISLTVTLSVLWAVLLAFVAICALVLTIAKLSPLALLAAALVLIAVVGGNLAILLFLTLGYNAARQLAVAAFVVVGLSPIVAMQSGVPLPWWGVAPVTITYGGLACVFMTKQARAWFRGKEAYRKFKAQPPAPAVVAPSSPLTEEPIFEGRDWRRDPAIGRSSGAAGRVRRGPGGSKIRPRGGPGRRPDFLDEDLLF